MAPGGPNSNADSIISPEGEFGGEVTGVTDNVVTGVPFALVILVPAGISTVNLLPDDVN